jgi:hypothetical protein
MKKFLVYPKGYDPAVASGPPGPFCISEGIVWTQKDTEYCRRLEKQAIVIDYKPTNQWYKEIEQ